MFIGGEIENELEGYLEMMRMFQKSVKIKQLKEVMSLVPKQDDTSDTCDVNIKLNGEWEEGTLENLQQLRKHMFCNKQYRLNHMTVDERDSLCITFTIPTSQLQGVVDEIKQSKTFIELVGVSRVSVGDVDILISKPDDTEFSLISGVNINDFNSEGKTALMLASEAGHAEVVDTLLSAGANVNIQDSAGQTALMFASESLIIICSLLSAKADPDSQNQDGNTVMHFACSVGNRELVNLLVKFNANPVIPNSKGETAFMISITNNSLDIVTDLIDLIPSTHIKSAVITSCRLRYPAISSLLLSNLHISAQVLDFFTEGDTSSMKRQLTESYPNTTLISGITPLMIASSCGHIEVLECLLQAKADVNSKDEDGYTPLAYAITGSKSLTIVQRLLQSGANPNILLGGISIIEKAKEENGTEEIVNLLLKYSALQLHKDYEQLPEKVKQLRLKRRN